MDATGGTTAGEDYAVAARVRPPELSRHLRGAARTDQGGPLNPLRITDADTEAAREWGFNCGPGALCAVLDKTPDELRPHLLDFEQRGYTNPTLMVGILRGLGVAHHRVWRCDLPVPDPVYPKFGLVRVQWAGPWTKPGVPMAVRYRKTHWIA